MCRTLKKVGIILITFILLLEGTFHLFFFQKLRIRHFPQVYTNDSLIGYKYAPGVSDFHASPAYYNPSFTINSLGFNDEEFEPQKHNGYFRIIVFDISTGVDSESPNNYVRQLRDQFTKEGHRIEIINCSVDGGERDVQRMALLVQDMLHFNADLILFNCTIPLVSKLEFRTPYKNFTIFNNGDLTQIDTTKRYIDTAHDPTIFLNRLFKYSFTFRYICKYYAENENWLTGQISRLPLLHDKKRIVEIVTQHIDLRKPNAIRYLQMPETFEKLKRLTETIKAANSKLVLFDSNQDLPIKSYFIQELGSEYLQIHPVFVSGSTFGELDGHLNSVGAKCYADAFYEALMSSNLIPNEYKNLPNQRVPKLNDSVQKFSLKDLNLDYNILGRSDKGHDEAVKVLVLNTVKDTTVDEYDMDIIHPQSIEIVRKRFDVRNFQIRINEATIDYSSPEEYLRAINDQVAAYQPQIVVLPLPYQLLRSHTTQIFNWIEEYQNILNKKNVILLFHYTFDDVNVRFQIVEEKQMAEQLLLQNSIQCSSSRVNLNSIFPPYERTSINDRLEQKIRTQANTLFLTLRQILRNTNVIESDFNIAHTKTVLASSSAEQKGFFQGSINDNVIASIFSWSKGWLSDTTQAHANHEEWISVDLEKNYSVKRVVLYPITEKGMVSYGFPVDFEIKASLNGVEWKTLRIITDYPLPDYEQPQVFTFDPCNARYIRILGTKLRKNSYPDGEFYRMGLGEMEVYCN